jgi:hypothetical protein
MIEYLINNYPETIPNNILSVQKDDIHKYNFVKMLVTRNLIDIAD